MASKKVKRQSVSAKRAAEFGAAVDSVLSEIRATLIDKNRRYGDSALSPMRVFSRASAHEGIGVRLDDKLSRIRSAQADDLEDAESDLLGYLVLRRIARARRP